MKEQILIVADQLKKENITTDEAQDLLLHLFGVMQREQLIEFLREIKENNKYEFPQWSRLKAENLINSINCA